MHTRINRYTLEQVELLELDDIKGIIGSGEHDFLFAYSPDAMRKICEQSAAAQRLLETKLTELFASTSQDAAPLYKREGFKRPMSDREWLGKILRIIRGVAAGEIFVMDVDEVGYAEARAALEERRAAREARAALKEAQRLEALRQIQPKALTPQERNDEPLAEHSPHEQAGIPVARDGGKHQETTYRPTSDTSTEQSPTDVVLFDVHFYRGQLQVSNLVTGSRLLTIGKGARKSWSASNPLVVSRISGVRAETTTIEYVGEELRVSDIETWVTALRYGAQAKDAQGARLPLGTDVQLREIDMLKAMRRGDSTPEYKSLRGQVLRLQNAKIIITTTYSRLIEAIAVAMPDDKDAQTALETKRLHVVVSLLGDSTSAAKRNAPGTFTITIPSRVRALFGKGLSVWFKEDEYYSLKSPTARRLFLLYDRHARPHPFTLAELQEFLGAKMADAPLRQAINVAHKELFAKRLISEVPKYKLNEERPGAKSYHIKLARNEGPVLRK
jgi:hypothetical protein